jgi:hypothetical protein
MLRTRGAACMRRKNCAPLESLELEPAELRIRNELPLKNQKLRSMRGSTWKPSAASDL